MARLSTQTVLAIACTATMMIGVVGCHNSASPAPPAPTASSTPAQPANSPEMLGREKDAEMRAKAMAAAHKQ